MKEVENLQVKSNKMQVDESSMSKILNSEENGLAMLYASRKRKGEPEATAESKKPKPANSSL